MLGSEIIKQGQLFLEAACYGALLSFLYDCLRIVRRVFRHGMVWVAVEDLLFWLFWALGMFGFMYRQNDGVIRGFLICGAALGMILYGVFASRYIVSAGTVVLKVVQRILRRVIGVVSAPFRKSGRFLCMRIKKYEHCLAAYLLRKRKNRHDLNFCSKSFRRVSGLQGNQNAQRDDIENERKKFRKTEKNN